ncbi:MAG: acyl-CoA thioesterase [Alphaproteobacteria bacterium]|nr:acyl-CoA thioesterase [Alphaproteobacteria bacterium]
MLVNRKTILIEWGDCDPAGIVYYPRYFAYFDAATFALFERAGIPKRTLMERYGIIGTPLVDARAKFVAPSSYGDEVVIESHVAEWRRSSFEIRHRLLKSETLAVEGIETRVWAAPHPDDPKRIKALPIPAEVAARFAG